MNQLLFRNPDTIAKAVHGGLLAATVTLSTAQDSATGVIIDSHAVVTGKRFAGIAMYVPITQSLATGLSILCTAIIQHCTASGGTYTELARGTLTLTGTTASGAHTGLVKVDANLHAAKRWITSEVIFLGSDTDTGHDRSATAITMVFFGPNYGPSATST